MKLLLQILVCIFLHPIAVILVWVDLARRDDLDGLKKLIWAIVGLIWGIGPILYLLVGSGKIW